MCAWYEQEHQAIGSWAQHSDAQVAIYTSKSQLKTVTKSEVGSVRMG